MARKINGRTVERGIYETGGYIYVRIANAPKLYIGPMSEAGIIDKAHIELHKRRDQIRAGKLGQEVKAERWLVEKAAGLYWDREAKNLKGAGVPTVIKRLKEFFGHLYLDEVTYQHVRDYREHLANTFQMQDLSINRHQEYVVRLFNVLKEWRRYKTIPNVKLPDENPAALVKCPKEHSRTRVLSVDEFERLVKASTYRVQRILIMGVNTLLRCKDLKGLTVSQSVNWAVNTIEGKQAKNDKHGLEFSLPINRSVRDIIERTDGDAVLDFTNFRKDFRMAQEASGVGRVMMTDIRRTGARWLLKSGVDIATVSKMLGHTTIAMTQRYVPPIDSDKQEAGIVLDKIFGNVVSVEQVRAVA